jgi:hypothetical protein
MKNSDDGGFAFGIRVPGSGIRDWRLGDSRLAAGGWRLAAGGWRLAAGGWRFEDSRIQGLVIRD